MVPVVMRRLYQVYNRTLDYIQKLEADGHVFVFRPEPLFKINRIEKDKNKLKALYLQGYHDAAQNYEAMKKYVKANIDFVYDYIKENIPELKMIRPEGTYLVWIDFRGLGLNDKQIDDLVINKAKLWLDSGRIFGNTGRGFQRVNVACPRKLLEQAMENLEKAIHELSEEKK